jgi:Xaa-Pro aminopeptidase
VTGRPNLTYLTGFTGEDSNGLITSDRAFLVTDSRFEEQAGAEAAVDEIVCRRGPMGAALASLWRRLGCRRIGFASARVTHAQWAGAGAAVPQMELAPFPADPILRMRSRKSREEVEAVRQALAIAEAAFRGAEGQLAEGMSERHMAGLLEWEMRRRGADEAAFETICAVDERASLPHARPTDRCARRGGVILFDWGARLEGYSSDLTRLTAVGTMPPNVADLAQVVCEAQEAALSTLGPGVRCCDVDRAARAVIARARYGRYFGHGLGHGVGLEVHEAPRLAAGEEEVLLPGMVVTVEPGIYLPGVAGVRVEDMVVITSGGFEVISSLERRPGGG